jgi:hypothetical protein
VRWPRDQARSGPARGGSGFRPRTGVQRKSPGEGIGATGDGKRAGGASGGLCGGPTFPFHSLQDNALGVNRTITGGTLKLWVRIQGNESRDRAIPWPGGRSAIRASGRASGISIPHPGPAFPLAAGLKGPAGLEPAGGKEHRGLASSTVAGDLWVSPEKRRRVLLPLRAKDSVASGEPGEMPLWRWKCPRGCPGNVAPGIAPRNRPGANAAPSGVNRMAAAVGAEPRTPNPPGYTNSLN